MARPDSEYNRKRDFTITPEPPEEEAPRGKQTPHAVRFVVQKHDARGLHYDFRLEIDGTLKSWAVPKGPSLDPKDRRMAIHTEDHPLAYATFEGHIPHGQYGGGDMIVWDLGIWQVQGDAVAAYNAGKLKFTLIGEKLSGNWTLVRTRGRGDSDKQPWLLIKEKDEAARPSQDYDILKERPESIITGELLPMDQTEPPVKKSIVTARKGNPKVKANAVDTLEPSVTTEPHTKPVKKPVKKNVNLAAKELTRVPSEFSPELATLVSEPPAGDWLYEIKFDGYRILTRVQNGKVNFFTRNAHDWTERLSVQAKAIEALQLKDSWLDGEVVVLNENGLPNFQALQNAFDIGKSGQIIYYLFDAPFVNGIDLRDAPVEERRQHLEAVLEGHTDGGPLRYSAAFDADHQSIVQSACALSLEGVIGKRVGSPYVSRRSDDWIKLKCRLRQEFVIVGYTEPQGSRSGFGALLLGVHNDAGDSELIYAGRTGTGFNEARLRDMYKKMLALETDQSPVSTKLTGLQAKGVHWIKPKLVCEVEFAEWTGEGILRQAAFISLRTDKPAKDIIREKPKTLNDVAQGSRAPEKSVNKKPTTKPAVALPKSKNAKVDIAGVFISHPERVLDVQSGGTKHDLAKFYDSISEFMLPHLSDRPVSLLRAPDGIAGEQFFQKHSEKMSIPHITQLDPALDPTHGRLMKIDNAGALVGCAQMNAIELHTWGSTSDAIETPDRFVLDLDPDPALPWRSMLEAARLTLSVLDELRLNAFLKTTGGKGLHIIVPLTPEANWDYVKAFSKAIADFMAKQIPERFVSKMGPQNRIGKIFIDYLRNSRGASTVCAYSVRARPGLPVSVPISRDELEKIGHSDQWNIQNLHERMEKLKGHPWGNYDGMTYKKTQKINKSMWKKLGT